MARIGLGDLEALGEEPTAAGGEDDDEERERARWFAHWEAVASTHRVSLPPDMAGPILQMTRHRQAPEPVPCATLSQQLKCEEAAYEERQYPAGKWACVTKGEPMYEQSISMSFMKLMRYICKDNSVGCYLGMTVPVLNEIHLTKEGTGLEREVITAYYLPGRFQQNPPVPTDPEIHITERSPLRVITRVFYGRTTEETILREISLFWELLGSTDTVLQGTYIVAAYENPSVPRRRNEIWFICRAE
ncbi:heme-binding protein 1-like [Pogoniulus pusillus]|uniref:heme-binding protein 1-like n=1 Tax=Pogoniulus pusillus TaxID=488313 RepID=UPI0030B963F2